MERGHFPPSSDIFAALKLAQLGQTSSYQNGLRDGFQKSAFN